VGVSAELSSNLQRLASQGDGNGSVHVTNDFAIRITENLPSARAGAGCCNACRDASTPPENLSCLQSRTGKEPDLKREAREALGPEELSSKDRASKAALKV